MHADSHFADRSFKTLICDTPRPGVARITLNRPASMNAYNHIMTDELQAAIALYRDDDELRALVLTGAGERAFCTGGDLGGGASDGGEHSRNVARSPMGHGREMREGMQAVVLALRRLDKPSLAMVRGYAVAGGPGAGAGLRFQVRRALGQAGRHQQQGAGFFPTKAAPGCSRAPWAWTGR